MDRLFIEFKPERPIAPEILTEVPPIAVELGERATALAAIMAFLNQAAKTEGARRAGKAFANRYGEHASEVLRGMDAKRSELRVGFEQGLDTLVAGSALRANGFDDEAIEQQRLAMQVAINRRFGVGKSNAHDRAQAVNMAKKAARKS